MSALEMLLRLCPGPSEALYWVTSVLAAQGRLTVPRHKEQAILIAVRYAALCDNAIWTSQHLTRLIKAFPSSASCPPALWNALCHLEKFHDQRNLIRWSDADPTNFPLLMILAHSFGSAFHRRIPLYQSAHRLRPDDPIPLLCLAVEHANKVRSRSSNPASRHTVWAMAVAYCDMYQRQRNVTIEGIYNMARLAQHVGLSYLAASLYRRVLKDSIGEDNFLGLRRCAALNLHFIYVASGSYELAHATLMEHIVV